MNIRNNLPLIFGISIPVLMIIFIALSIYIPQLFAKPQYDFLYLTGHNTCYPIYVSGNANGPQPIYLVVNNRITENQKCATFSERSKIFLYDISANLGKEISFADAQSLILDSSAKSPDGFEIASGNNNGGGFFPFFYSGSDYYSKYISGHNISKKLNLSLNYYDFSFLGWVNK